MKTTTPLARNSINRTFRHCGTVAALLIPLMFALTSLTLLPKAGAQCPQMCNDQTDNTALGIGALVSNTSGTGNTGMGFQALNLNQSGSGNTGIGSIALNVNTSGNMNTGTGFQVLFHNQPGSNNTATGANALFNNFTGHENTATGEEALLNNFSGSGNTAVGYQALYGYDGDASTATGFQALMNNNSGFGNNADGYQALLSNTTGGTNTATGFGALTLNTTGNSNTATGYDALLNNSTGNSNTAYGHFALLNTTGNSNIALGDSAGSNLTTGKNNIDIGNAGVAGEANKIRIGTTGVQKATFIASISGVTVPAGVGVIVGTDGKLGTVVSSERFKDAIQPMDKASEAILALKPVTFRYKHELDPVGIPQFGLVAEDVEKVNPDLVARDAEGKVFTVRYEAVNAMLLNEFLKEHHTVQEQGATIAEFKKEIANLTATVKEQAAQIQKVSAQVELSKPVARTVLNNQ